MTPLLALQMRAYRNARYHEDRQAFFETSNRWSNFAVVVLGSSAAASALSTYPLLAVIGSGASALVGALQLVFDFCGKARTHLELRKSFSEIAAEATSEDANIAEMEIRLARLYKDEPEVYHAVNALAYNAAQNAFDRGKNTNVVVTRWQRFFRHFKHFDPSEFDDGVVA